ncbi:MAG: EamA/RhaT family transporter, partial [Candidatus Nanopelagicales bacterium]
MWGHIAVVAVTFNVIPFILFAWAQTHISSVLAGIWSATTPLWTVPMALLLVPSTRLDPRH